MAKPIVLELPKAFIQAITLGYGDSIPEGTSAPWNYHFDIMAPSGCLVKRTRMPAIQDANMLGLFKQRHGICLSSFLPTYCIKDNLTMHLDFGPSCFRTKELVKLTVWYYEVHKTRAEIDKYIENMIFYQKPQVLAMYGLESKSLYLWVDDLVNWWQISNPGYDTGTIKIVNFYRDRPSSDSASSSSSCAPITTTGKDKKDKCLGCFDPHVHYETHPPPSPTTTNGKDKESTCPCTGDKDKESTCDCYRIHSPSLEWSRKISSCAPNTTTDKDKKDKCLCPNFTGRACSHPPSPFKKK
jgi:hypothetical protein